MVTPATRSEAALPPVRRRGMEPPRVHRSRRSLAAPLKRSPTCWGMGPRAVRARAATIPRARHRQLQTTQRRVIELIAFASQLETAAARLDRPPIDGPCANDCACFSDNDSPSATLVMTPVMLSVTASDPPIACTLHADAVPARIERWRALLVRPRTHHDTGRKVASRVRSRSRHRRTRALVAAEQQCCSFFGFTVTIDARGSRARDRRTR